MAAITKDSTPGFPAPKDLDYQLRFQRHVFRGYLLFLKPQTSLIRNIEQKSEVSSYQVFHMFV